MGVDPNIHKPLQEFILFDFLDFLLHVLERKTVPEEYLISYFVSEFIHFFIIEIVDIVDKILFAVFKGLSKILSLLIGNVIQDLFDFLSNFIYQMNTNMGYAIHL